jgi:hypothetical protein
LDKQAMSLRNLAKKIMTGGKADAVIAVLMN